MKLNVFCFFKIFFLREVVVVVVFCISLAGAVNQSFVSFAVLCVCCGSMLCLV